MVLSLGGSEGRAWSLYQRIAIPRPATKVIPFSTEFATLSLFLGFMVLKLILSKTDNLSRYLQGEQMDAITAKKTGDAVINTLSNCLH